MIQRIQTVYLLLIVIASVVLLWRPVLSFTSTEDAGVQRFATLSAIPGLQEQALVEDAEFVPDADVQPLTLNGTWGLLVTTALIAGVLFMYVWFAKMNLGMDWHILPWAAVPLVCFVLTLMATRAILKDEALVRAADRIR